MCREMSVLRPFSAGLTLLTAALALLLPSLVRSDVYIMTPSCVFDALPDIPADFGPELPETGVEGYLRVADPEDGCGPFTFTDFSTNWVALVARNQQTRSNNCTFDVKVLNAQAAGAIAVVVYDDIYESLIIMSKPKGHADPFIPAVFVSQKAGLIMKKLMTLDVIRVRITPLSTVAWMSMFMSAFLGFVALGVVLATFYVMRSWSVWLGGASGGPRRSTGGGAQGAAAGGGAAGQQAGQQARSQQENGLPADVLRALPVVIYDANTAARYSLPGSPVKGRQCSAGGGGSSTAPRRDLERGLLEEAEEVFEDAEDAGTPCSHSSSECGDLLVHAPRAHAGETKRTCAVCLESYCEGEKIRVLPCKHRFHMDCIDQWLGGRRFCPVCKHDASQPLHRLQSTAAAPAARAGLSNGGAGAAGGEVLNGWSLLLQGLIGLVRPPRSSRRAGLSLEGRSGTSGPAAGGELQEPLLPVTQLQRQPHEAGAAADVEAGRAGAASAVPAPPTPSAVRRDSPSPQPVAAAPIQIPARALAPPPVAARDAAAVDLAPATPQVSVAPPPAGGASAQQQQPADTAAEGDGNAVGRPRPGPSLGAAMRAQQLQQQHVQLPSTM